MPQDALEPIPFVQRIPRKGGRVDLYFRHRPTGTTAKLTSPDNSDALRAEVDAHLARIGAAAAAQVPKAGTVGGMVTVYAGDGKRQRASAEFLALAASTQIEYGRIADELVEDAGQVLLQDVTPAWVRDMRDAWAARGYKAANDRLTVLHNALQPAIDDDRIAGEPFGKVKRARRPHDLGEANPAWTDEEVAIAIDRAIAKDQPGLARGIAAGRFGGFRRGTICSLPLHARVLGVGPDGQAERRLYWITEKRKVLCDKREDPRLTEILARTPARALTVAYNADGGRFKERQFNQALGRLMDSLAREGLVRTVIGPDGKPNCPLTPHGLRHARGIELAETGASDAEIMAQLEHATPRAAAIYRRQAERRRLADNAQDRIDNAVSLKAERAKRTAQGEKA